MLMMLWCGHFSHSGHYNVRSGYLVALDIKGVEPLTEVDGEINNSVGVVERRWKHLWKLNIPRKVGLFLWKCFREILPTRRELHRRRIVEDQRCPVCGDGVESVVHLFCNCSLAQRVWAHTSLSVVFGDVSFDSFPALWDALEFRWQHALNGEWLLSLAAVTLWFIW